MLRHVLLFLAFAAAFATPACTSPARVTFIPEGGSYAGDELKVALDESDPGRVAKVKTAEASDVRQDALANLRRNGEDAGDLADTLTAEFPVDVAAVPYRVEKGAYDGTPAWIVFEAWGEPGGQLSYRRVWVFSGDDLSVIATHSGR